MIEEVDEVFVNMSSMSTLCSFLVWQWPALANVEEIESRCNTVPTSVWFDHRKLMRQATWLCSMIVSWSSCWFESRRGGIMSVVKHEVHRDWHLVQNSKAVAYWHIDRLPQLPCIDWYRYCDSSMHERFEECQLRERKTTIFHLTKPRWKQPKMFHPRERMLITNIMLERSITDVLTSIKAATKLSSPLKVRTSCCTLIWKRFGSMQLN